jgi:hypothetical protein
VTARTTIGEIGKLQQILNEQTNLLAAVTADLADTRALVSRGQTEVLRRIQELQTAMAHPQAPSPARSSWPPEPAVAQPPQNGAQVASEAGMSPADYARLVTRIRALVRTVVPAEAIVVVASRGDEALVDLDGRAGWHFPRCDDGRYAGHHPRDSEAAIEHLEELRRRGARYLLFPATAMWWLKHYDGLRQHLEDNYRLALHREDACMIFDLFPRESH